MKLAALRSNAVLLSLVALLGSGCGDDEAAVDELAVRVPDGWVVESTSRGTRRILTLRPPSRTSLCRVIVVRDGRVFDSDDARALLGDGRASFSGRDRRDARLDTALGPMEGFTVRGPAPDPSWSLVPAEGELVLELYAAALEVRLVSVLFAGWSRADATDASRTACLGAVRSMTHR